MKVIVSIEIGGVEQKNFHQELEISPPNNLFTLSKLDFITLLNQKPLTHPLTEHSIISYYDEERHAYRTLKPSDSVPIQDSLRILIRKDLTLSQLQTTVKDLQSHLATLISKLEKSSTKGDQKRGSRAPIKNKFEHPYTELDIAMLGATPLVNEDVPIEDCALDFEVERRNLTKKLTDSGNGADIRFEVATLDNLAEILECKPKILYILCQGFYKKTPVGEFVLAFEKSIECGEGTEGVGCLEEVGVEKLKKIFDNSPQYFQVLIVKGVYSQEMAKVFRKAGFPCVIAVHHFPEYPNSIEDDSANDFIADFCISLLSGNSVLDAYKSQSENYNDGKESCCCAHSHESSCEWLQELNLSSIWENHRQHALVCTCNPERQEHKSNCHTALLKFRDDSFVICCFCSERFADPSFKHEGYKCSKHYSDESVMETVLFEAHNKILLNVVSELPDSWKPPYNISFTDARRKEINDLLGLVINNRTVNLYGQSGMGKTMMLKRAGYYAYERRLFGDGVVYFDFTKKDIVFLYRTISKTLNLPVFDHYTDLFSVLNTKDVLLIMDNIDELISEQSTVFYETYEKIINNTTKPKFIIGCCEPVKIPNVKSFELLGLTHEQKIKFIKRREKNARDNDIAKAPSNPSSILEFLENFRTDSGSNRFRQPNESNKLGQIKLKVKGSEHFLQILKNLQFGAFPFSIQQIWPQVQETFRDQSPGYEEMMNNLRKVAAELNSPPFPHPCLDYILIPEPNDEFFRLKPDILKIIENQPQQQDRKIKYFQIAMKTLAVIARSILTASMKDSFQIGCEYRNSLWFFNAALDHGVWSRFKQPLQVTNRIYDPRVAFERIEYNFWGYIKDTDLKKIYSSELEMSQEVKEYLGEIILCTASNIMMFGNRKEVGQYLERSQICCRVFNMDMVLNIVNLFRAAVFVVEKQVPEALKSLEEAEKGFCDASDILGVAECKLLKAMITENSERKMENLLEVKIEFKNAGCVEGYARALLAYVEVKNELGHFDEEFYSACSEAIEIFEKSGLKHWGNRTAVYLADYFFLHEKLSVSREVLEKSLKSVKGYKDSKTEREITQRLQKINERIIQNSKNSICLLKGFPLIEKTSNDIISRAGLIWRYSSSFRPDLMKSLRSANKKIYVRMDILSQEKLEMCLKEKPAILHLASEMQSPDTLHFEKENGLSHKILFEDFKKILESSPAHNNIQLVVFAMPCSSDLALKFYHDLKIKHVVYFDFPDYPREFTQSLLNLVFERSIHYFTINFYTKLANQKSVLTAFQESKAMMQVFMESELRKFLYLEINSGEDLMDWWTEHKENDPVLVDEENLVHLGPVFQFDSESEGDIVELSSVRGPCNVKCDGLPFNTFVGRQAEMYNLMNNLSQTRCINLFGCEGIGKTEFIKQVAYYLYVRNKYSDGIFLLQLRDKHSLEDVYRECKNEGLVGLSTDIDPKTVLLGKKILLILENCEAMIQKAPHTLNSLLQKFVNECKISVIITSLNHLLKIDLPDIKRIALRNMTKNEIYALLCLSMPQFVSRKLEGVTEKELYTEVVEKLLKEFQGVPGNVQKYKSLLEMDKLENIREMLMGNIDELGDDDNELLLPEFGLKRSSSTYKELMKFPQPRLVSGRSSCEYLFKMSTTEV